MPRLQAKTKEYANKLANREINSRTIPGSTAEVVWLMYEDEHFLFVMCDNYDCTYVKSTKDPVEAKQFFDHPLADKSGPSVF